MTNRDTDDAQLPELPPEWVPVTERMEPPDAPPETVAELRAAFREYRPTAGIAVTGVRGREVDLQFPDGSLHTAVLKRPPGRPPKRGRPTGAQALPPAGKLAQHTFPEAKTVSAGLADGPKQRGWGELEGEPSLMHRLDDDAPLATVVRGGPFLDWLGLPATAEGLREELRQAGLPAVLLLHVLIGGSLVLIQRNRIYVTVATDDLVKAIGWKPRSSLERETMRRKVWRWVALLDACEVIGRRPGTYRDPTTREVLDLTSRDALLRVVGRREPAQLAFDQSAPPLELTYVAGPWVEQWRGNRGVLTYFAVDVRRVAAIPAGKPSGAWAQAIGLALHQQWRERAADRPGESRARRTTFTRRELLDLFPPEPTLDDVLGGRNPALAKHYWREAIGLLKRERLLGAYRELTAAPAQRQGWQAEWADTQRLDIRPPEEAREALAEVAGAAAEARARARRRRARRPPLGGGGN